MKIFKKIDVFLFTSAVLLVVLIGVITVLVFRFFINELIESTINNLFIKQNVIVSAISKHLEEGPRMVSQVFSTYKDSDHEIYALLIKRMKHEFPYCKLMWLIIQDGNGNVEESISNFDWELNPAYIRDKRRKDDIILSFSSDGIVRIGSPYRDSMNINTIVPVFIDHYKDFEIRATLFLEINISELLYDAKRNIVDSFDTLSGEYEVCLYAQNMDLVETSENYPVVRVFSVLTREGMLEGLSDREMLKLRSFAEYHRIAGEMIELYSLSPTGHIIRGTIPYSLILSKVRSLILVIIGIGLIALALLLIVGQTSIHYRQVKEKEIQLQIETLQAKLDPHFLFNILNSMVGLVVDNNNECLLRSFKSLSVLLRSSIAIKDNHIPLREELDYIDNYVDIQRLRFENEFEYSVIIEDESLLDLSIPRFSIQPIIENCFVHAVAVNEEEEKIIYIRLGVKRENKLMFIDICNNGAPCMEEKNKLKQSFKTNVETNSGGRIGLTLINKEIKLLYGGKFGLEILDTAPDIFSVRIKLPASFNPDHRLEVRHRLFQRRRDNRP
ncbi:MAG: histidine kinase [Treponema sp.]|nr:histidine kinase [Treponema sp.]